MSKNFSAELSIVNVQNAPNTPPLNKFGGNFENGWELFFTDLDMHLQQMQSVVQEGDIVVNRNGMVVCAMGRATEEKKSLGVRPAMSFSNGSVSVDADGNVSAEEPTDFSITFIARD